MKAVVKINPIVNQEIPGKHSQQRPVMALRYYTNTLLLTALDVTT